MKNPDVLKYTEIYKGYTRILKLNTDTGIAMVLKLSEHRFVSVFYVFRSFYGHSKCGSGVITFLMEAIHELLKNESSG